MGGGTKEIVMGALSRETEQKARGMGQVKIGPRMKTADVKSLRGRSTYSSMVMNGEILFRIAKGELKGLKC